MANITVTSTSNTIKVAFNDYSSVVGDSLGTWQKKNLQFRLNYFQTFVKVYEGDFATWPVSFDGSDNSFIIDSVDGVAPTSNLDLYNKLIALIA